MAAQYRGDAVLSYGVLRSASEVFKRDARLPAVMSLFSLMEAVVLYERLWYLPLGDPGSASASRFEIWDALQTQKLISSAPEALWSNDSRTRKAAAKDWNDKITLVAPAPTYTHISQQELLQNTFNHALKTIAWVYADMRPPK
ncbi:MAG TPA: hypothetical protein VM532_12470, partial [Burkholderiales bacterium]|nr:hypothetical protein [Burkholderiales bacterium]